MKKKQLGMPLDGLDLHDDNKLHGQNIISS